MSFLVGGPGARSANQKSCSSSSPVRGTPPSIKDDRDHPRHMLEAAIDLADVRERPLSGGSGGRCGHGEAESKNAPRLEAGIGARQRNQAANDEAGTGEKNQSRGDFENDKPVLRAMAHATGAAAAFPECVLRLLRGDPPCWKHAEENTNRKGEHKRKEENEGAEMDLRGARERSRDKLERGACSPNWPAPGRSAPPAQSKERALGQELPDDAPAAGAKGETNRRIPERERWSEPACRLATLTQAMRRTKPTAPKAPKESVGRSRRSLRAEA